MSEAKTDFVLFNPRDFDHCQFLYESQQDPAWNHLLIPQGEQFGAPAASALELQAQQIAHRERGMRGEHYLITYAGDFVGDVSVMIDPPHLLRRVPNTGWLGIAVYREDLHGKGIALAAMEHIEHCARRLGLVRLELGVFEFNTRSLHFARKLGFQEIGRVEKFTLWNGRLWDDIRLEKLF